MNKLIIFTLVLIASISYSQSVLTLGNGTSVGVLNNTDLCANFYNGVQLIYGNGTLCANVIGIEPDPSAINMPTEYKLSQNYPNPFNPETTIKYQLPRQAYVFIKLYDVIGKETEIFSGEHSAGYYNLTISAEGLASGIYFLKLNAGDYSKVIKMSVIK